MPIRPSNLPEAVDAVFDLACANYARDGFVAETLTGFDAAGGPCALVMSGVDLDVDHARHLMADHGLVLPGALAAAATTLLVAHMALHGAQAAIYVGHLAHLPDLPRSGPVIAAAGIWPSALVVHSRIAAVTHDDRLPGNGRVPVGLPDGVADGLVGLHAWLAQVLPEPSSGDSLLASGQ